MVLREKDDADYYYNVYRDNPTQENLEQIIKYRPQDHNDEIAKKVILDEIREEKKNNNRVLSREKITSKIVLRDPNKLKFDPNQPRKKFNKEAIENLGNSLLSQGVINPPEIDQDDIIITGEMRVRAAQLKKLDQIKCSVLFGLDDIKRFERQTIENLHHNKFTSIERENAVKKLWESGRYPSQKELGIRIGVNQQSISQILKAYKTREELKNEKIPAAGISTRNLSTIGTLPKKEDRKKIAQKLTKKEITPKDVRKVVKIVKDLDKKAPELKEEILQPEIEITDDKINEVKKVAKKKIEEKKNSKKPKPNKIKEEDRRMIDYFENAYKMVLFRMKSESFEDMGKITREKCLEFMQKTSTYLIEQLKALTNLEEKKKEEE